MCAGRGDANARRATRFPGAPSLFDSQSDRKQFERNCSEYGIAYPFGPTHLNVKTLAAVACGWVGEVGMREALMRIGLTLEGTHHRGDADAWNVAAILSRVLRLCRAEYAGSASCA
jgi:inhibitor of KinA sporulation pathway (predicted exonuclease)